MKALSLRSFGPFWRGTLMSGSAASVLSTALVLLRSRRETGSVYAALNAVSHWLWGPRAYLADEPSWRHTAPALAIHHASAMFWGALFEVLLRLLRPRPPKSADPSETNRASLTFADVAATAAIVTGVAALTDLRIVPERLSPGFENRLQPGSVALVYLAFGCGLLAAGAWRARRASSPRPRVRALP